MNRDSSRSHCIFTIYVETAETSHPVRPKHLMLIEWETDHQNGQVALSGSCWLGKIKENWFCWHEV